jgi:hypothetical protein
MHTPDAGVQVHSHTTLRQGRNLPCIDASRIEVSISRLLIDLRLLSSGTPGQHSMSSGERSYACGQCRAHEVAMPRRLLMRSVVGCPLRLALTLDFVLPSMQPVPMTAVPQRLRDCVRAQASASGAGHLYSHVQRPFGCCHGRCVRQRAISLRLPSSSML